MYLMTEYLTNTIPIDCYKDVELFKTIVEMEDYTKFRKSTVEEIIKFFKHKNRKIWDQK